jgi:dTDP-glucose 4,6-dehydratase
VVNNIVKETDVIINFAAESHVDRSITSSEEFIKTNVLGTQVLLDAAKNNKIKKFIQVSTDEVYGSIEKGSWDESHPVRPNSPYSASKAAADLLVRAYFVTHGLNTNTTRCSNNFGPRQDPEKLIPHFILKLQASEKIPVYGDGKNVRDWLYVEDHCKGIYVVMTKGIAGETYNIGGGTELTNLELTSKLLEILGKDFGYVEFIADRLGHDRRYSVDSSKIQKLGYQASKEFERNLIATINSYISPISSL